MFICSQWSRITSFQIWEEDLHPTAWRACPLLYVQAPSWLHPQQPFWLWLCNSGQEDRWILRSRCQHYCQRCSDAACSKGPVSNSLQTGTSLKIQMSLILQCNKNWDGLIVNLCFFLCVSIIKRFEVRQEPTPTLLLMTSWLLAHLVIPTQLKWPGWMYLGRS